MTASEILQLIETVDPADTDKLDEIDAAVIKCLARFYWDDGSEIDDVDIELSANAIKVMKNRIVLCQLSDLKFPQYSRSRDALKAIRPEGWLLDLCGTTAKLIRESRKVVGIAATEELAELHAIIQAIEYERGQE